VLVLPLHAAANLAAERIAAGITGAVAVGHAWEAPPGDTDHYRIARTLAGYAANPNVHAVVMIAIRGSDVEIPEMAIHRGARVHVVAMGDHRGTLGTVDAARPLVASLVNEAAGARRDPMQMSGIVLGLE
jgi:altronate dehydratase